MPGSLGNLWSATHWLTALQTGLVTGVVALLLSFTPVARLYRHRLGNAAIVGGLTAFGDAYAHPNHYGFLHAEALLTGAVSALLALVASYLFEDRARRVRSAWSRLRGGSRDALAAMQRPHRKRRRAQLQRPGHVGEGLRSGTRASDAGGLRFG